MMTTDLSTLMRKEVELAREELKEEGRKAGKAGGAFAGAAVVGLLAGIALVMTLGLGLGALINDLWWLGFLIVTIILGVVAAVLAQRGRTEVKALNPAPEQTIETLKEDAQWLNERRS
jgi:F0F1-type ATP synthase assembly protein I